MPEAPIWHPCQGAEAVYSTYPVVALCLPPANFSNRFAVKHTIHNYILHITMQAIDITRALNLSVNLNLYSASAVLSYIAPSANDTSHQVKAPKHQEER